MVKWWNHLRATGQESSLKNEGTLNIVSGKQKNKKGGQEKDRHVILEACGNPKLAQGGLGPGVYREKRSATTPGRR